MSENMEGRSEERRKKDKRKRAWKEVKVLKLNISLMCSVD